MIPAMTETDEICEIRTYRRGEEIINGISPLAGTPERFQFGLRHGYMIAGQQLQGQGVFNLDAPTIQEAFAMLPRAIEEAKRRIEHHGRQQVLLAGANEQALHRARGGFNGRLAGG